MGYYTKFDLEVINDNSDINHHFEVSQESEYGCDDVFDDDIKWHNHENDMLSYSKKYPNVVFKLLGKGEIWDDHWIKYFKNGKIQRCYAKIDIKFDDFDENKLNNEE